MLRHRAALENAIQQECSAMLAVRYFATADLDAVLEVRHDSILNIAAQDYSADQVRIWADRKMTRESQLKRLLEATTTWVAELDQRVVGFTNLGSGGYLDCMYVHSSFQRRGVATALLQELEIAARQQRLDRLHSEVSITARPFFERRGFAVIAPHRATLDGAEYDNFLMEKML
jgi:putative acetyltransferase